MVVAQQSGMKGVVPQLVNEINKLRRDPFVRSRVKYCFGGNHAQFSIRPVISETPPPSAPWLRDLLWLVLISGAAYFFLLGRPPLVNPDEGRYAEISREMVATGDWVTPRLDGINYFEKPPLVYWAVAVMESLFGPGEWAARAVVALCSVKGVCLAYLAGRLLYGRAAGIWAAVVLGTSLLYFALGHILLLDMAVTVLISAALFCFIVALRIPAERGQVEKFDPAESGVNFFNLTPSCRRWLLYGFYSCAALATLTKGLIGFMLPGAVIFLWLLLFNQWRRLRPLFLPSGVLLFLAIAAPWHLLVASRNPSWAHFYFIHEQFQRFSTTEAHRVAPWWIFAPIVLFGLFPWTGFLWPALRAGLCGGWARRKENADAWFLVTWAAFIFLFFSKSQSKLIPYILPVFPPLAVLIGAWISKRGQAMNSVRQYRIHGLTPFLVFVAISWLLAATAVLALLRPGLLIHKPDQVAVLRPWLYALAAALAAGGTATLLSGRPGGRRAMGCLLATTALVLGILAMAPRDLAFRGTKTLALEFKGLARPGDLVYSYHGFFHDFTFYAQHTIGLVAYTDELEPGNDRQATTAGMFISEGEFRRQWAGPARIFAVADRSATRELFADPGFHYHLLGEDPRHYLFSNR
jgi:4-amino-4-deoxy-L-arabinose transferase-like glycosyltransferase